MTEMFQEGEHILATKGMSPRRGRTRGVRAHILCRLKSRQFQDMWEGAGTGPWDGLEFAQEMDRQSTWWSTALTPYNNSHTPCTLWTLLSQMCTAEEQPQQTLHTYLCWVLTTYADTTPFSRDAPSSLSSLLEVSSTRKECTQGKVTAKM